MMPSQMGAEMISLIAACAAAVAATAAWANVVLGRLQWKASQKPWMSLTIFKTERGIEVYVSNSGLGVAREPAWAIAAEKEWLGGWASPDAMLLESGRSIKVRTGLTTQGDEARAVMLCKDAFGVTHVWDLKGKHKELRSRWLRRPLPMPRAGEALEQLYPDVTTSELEKVAGSIPKDE